MRSLVEQTARPLSAPAGARRTSPAEPTSAVEPDRPEGWLRAERLLAVVVTVVIGMRLVVLGPLLLTAGDLLAVGLAPLWFPATRRYAGARLLLLLGGLTIVAGVVLTTISADDHRIRTTSVLIAVTLVISVLSSFGFMLWARERLGVARLSIVFGLGMLIAVSQTGAQYTANPWRFGFSVGVTVLVLALCSLVRHRLLSLTAVVVLCGVSALTDARSSFALLLLTATLLAWELRPLKSTHRGSATRVLLGLAIVAAVVYNVGQALILNGYLGVKTQQRSLQQYDETGSLILGGRPELTATLALMRDHFLGFGMGAQPNHHDISVAKAGMAAINYDPDNGYVENFMFGNGFSLHSVAGDLWVQAGVVGLFFAVATLVLVLRGVTHRMALDTATALLLYVSLKTAWNFFFSPWYSSLTVLELALALTLVRRPGRANPREATNAQPPRLAETADLATAGSAPSRT